MKNRLLPLCFLVLVTAVTAATFLGSPGPLDQNMLVNIGRPPQMAEDLEGYFQKNLSLRTPLRNLNLKLRTMAGQGELDGFYLTGDGLIPTFTPTEDSAIQRNNTQGILDFATREGVPTAVMLLPTPSAVYHDRLPPYAGDIQFNQRSYLESVNRKFSGAVAWVDVYATLFASREESLYYRTDSTLTTRGGYLVYQSLANRLSLSPLPAQGFRQQFLPEPYYGDLYEQWGYGGVKGDTIVLYHSQSPAQFEVRHWLRFEDKIYYTLYPDQAAVNGNPMNTLLGGHSPRMDIRNLSLSPGHGSLLVLGDRNALSFLPFLAYHYSQITFADPDLLTDSELAALAPGDYGQVLFTFSLDRYMNSSQPTRAAQAGTDTE